MATWLPTHNGFQRQIGTFNNSGMTLVYVTDELTTDTNNNVTTLKPSDIEADVPASTETGNENTLHPPGTILLYKRLIAGPSRGCAAVACVFGPPTRFTGSRFSGTRFSTTFQRFRIPKYQQILSLSGGRGAYRKLPFTRFDGKGGRPIVVIQQTKAVTPPNEVAIDDFIASIAKNYGRGYVIHNIPCIFVDSNVLMTPGSPTIVTYTFHAPAPVKEYPRNPADGFELALPPLGFCQDYAEILDPTTKLVVGVRAKELSEDYQQGDPLP